MEQVKKFFFQNTSIKQTVIKNTTWLFVGEIVMRFLKLILFIYAARKLGTSEWGVFSYALALMSTFEIISDIGVNSVILRETARKTNNVKEYISTSFFLKLFLSFISATALFSLIFFIKNTDAVKILIPITALMLFFDSMGEFGFSLNRAFEKMELEAMTKIATTALLVVLGFVFILDHPKAISISYAYLIAGIVETIIMYFILRPHFSNLFSTFNKNLIPFIFREAWPLATVAIIGIIMSNIDMVILGWFTNSNNIGLYSAAQKPVQIIYLVPSLLSTAIFPVFSRLALTDKEKIKSVIRKSLNFSLIIALLINAGVLLIGGPIFKLAFGQQYISAIPLFKIMSLAIITGGPGIIISNALFALGEQKRLIQFISVTLVTDIILCLILIPRYGIYGAAIAVTVSQTIGNLFLITKSRKILK
jgi:O-antigen/teichoic acid export membrane protein